MKLPGRGTVEHGARVISLSFPWPWPPQQPSIIEYDLIDGFLRLTIGKASVIRGAVYREDKTTAYEAITCPLIAMPHALAVIVFNWGNKEARIWVNGRDLTYPFGPPWFMAVRADSDNTSVEDFTEKNSRSVRRREGKYGQLQTRPGMLRGGDAYLIEALMLEADQLLDLISLVKSGKNSHIRGLAARLRLLLVRDGQVPLLQAVAALKKAPLIIFTQSYPSLKIPVTPAVFINSHSISAVCNLMCPNPVDIDIWLNFTGLQLGHKTFSHHDIISDIGNTIGSHLDINILPSLSAMRSTKLRNDGLLFDGIDIYIINVAEAVHALCKMICDLH